MKNCNVLSGRTTHLVRATSVSEGEEVRLPALCGKKPPLMGGGKKVTCKKCKEASDGNY